MKMKKRISLVMAGLLALLSLTAHAPAYALERPAPQQAVQDGCSVTSMVSGQMSIHELNGKKVYYSGRVEAAETFFIPGLQSGQQYRVIVDTDEGNSYFGTLETSIQDGQLTGALQLDELGSAPMGRSTFSIQYETESNDSIKKANAMTGDTIYGKIEKKLLFADVDYFKITIPRDGDYAFVLDDIPAGKDYDLALYNSKSKQIASSSTTASTEFIKLEDAKAGEIYYCMVEGYKKASDNNNAYRVQYAPVLSVSDDHGNKQSTATLIELVDLTTILDGNINYPKDVDFFTFTAVADGEYTIFTTGNIDTIGILYDAGENTLAENDNGINWNFSITVNLLEGERYFLAVKHSGIGTGAYVLNIIRPDTQGPQEPQEPNAGDSFDTATPIEIGFGKDGWHASAQDGRYFSFTPAVSGSYGFYTTGDAIDTYGTLYAQDRTTIMTENDNANGSQHFSMAKTLLAGNTYYIKVIASQYDANAKYFSLHVQQYEAPNDTEFALQHYMLNLDTGYDINILPALSVARGEGVKVAVADSGIDFSHGDFEGKINMSLSYNFTHDTNDIFPFFEPTYDSWSAAYGHGTHVAGIIGSGYNNHFGTAGIAPDVDLIGYKVYGSEIEGIDYYDPYAAFVASIGRAKGDGTQIINASFGGTYAMLTESEAIRDASNILFVTAAGNKSYNLDVTKVYPACYGHPNILVVASADSNGSLSSFSNYGGPAAVAAPGSSIYSTIPYGDFGYKSGTSMSTPMVTGISALVLSKNPSLTPVEVKNIISDPSNTTIIPALHGKVTTSGMVDAYKAVASDGPTRTPQSFANLADMSRNPFSTDRDIKEVITEIKEMASDSEKTGSLFIKWSDGAVRDEICADVKEMTGLEFSIKESGIQQVSVVTANSIGDADALVDAFNTFDAVVYAEPIYTRDFEF